MSSTVSGREPVARLRHQRLAQRLIVDGFNRFTDESLDHQRLGFLLRNAARLQIEQQIVIERTGGGAMAADHVVGEDFQFRLVIGFGLFRQQQRMRAPSCHRSSARAAAR